MISQTRANQKVGLKAFLIDRREPGMEKEDILVIFSLSGLVGEDLGVKIRRHIKDVGVLPILFTTDPSTELATIVNEGGGIVLEIEG